jgi:hypothetical protein
MDANRARHAVITTRFVSSRAENKSISDVYQLLDILEGLHPDETQVFISSFGGQIAGIDQGKRVLQDQLIRMVREDSDSVFETDPRFRSIADTFQRVAADLQTLADNSWVKVQDTFTVSAGYIGQLTLDWDHYECTSPTAQGAKVAGAVPSTTSAIRDTGSLAGGPFDVTGTAGSRITDFYMDPTPELDANKFFTAHWVQWFTVSDEMYVGPAAVTWAGALGSAMLTIASCGSGTLYDYWTVDIICTERSSTAEPVAVKYGPNEALNGIGFAMSCKFKLPDTWMKNGAPTAFPSTHHWYTSLHGFYSGPLRESLEVELLQGYTLTWTELVSPVGVSLPSVTIHMTIRDLSTRITDLETATGDISAAATASHSGYESLGNKIAGGLKATGAIAGLIGALSGQPEIAGLGKIIGGLGSAIAKGTGLVAGFYNHPIAQKLAGYIMGTVMAGHHAIGMVKASGESLSAEAISFAMQEIASLKYIANLPAGMKVTDAMPHGLYFMQKLALNLGPLSALGDTLVDAQIDGRYDSEKVLKLTNLVPIHASTVLIFPEIRNTVSINDKDGVVVVTYIRRVAFVEFGGTLGGGVPTNGKGTLTFIWHTQYWDSSDKGWYWSMTTDSSYTNGVPVTGTNSERAAMYEQQFFTPERATALAYQYDPVLGWPAFKSFRDAYLTLGGRYNILRYNCQTLAREVERFMTSGQYPRWWTPAEVNNQIFEYLKLANASQVTPAFTGVQLNGIGDALLMKSVANDRYGRAD